MIILICGYSASGKSYVARFVSKKLKYKIVYTSDILKQFTTNKTQISIKTKMNKGWYERSNLIELRKNDFSFDKNLDKYLLSLVNKNTNLILDSSTLPYLLKKKKGVIKIWLNATKKVRVDRMSKRDVMTYNEALKHLNKKDNFNITHYRAIYGFDFGKDLSVFDYVLDTTNLNMQEVFECTLAFIKNKL
jgi:cytidylate kinase